MTISRTREGTGFFCLKNHIASRPVVDRKKKMVYNKIGVFLKGVKSVRIEIPEYVEKVMSRLEAFGKEAYIVGGGLRDSLLGKTPSDYDMTTSALPEEMLEIFADHRVIETGLKHGTLTVISDGNPIEITTFRVDGGYTDSRHPDSVSFTRSLPEDLARRDFTVNAMAYNSRVGLVDRFGGIEDLDGKTIRAVGDPRKRFGEDALRIMRAFRFSAQLGFEIEGKTLEAAVECRQGLSYIASERIFSELLRLLYSEHPENPLRQMRDGGILEIVLCGYSPSDRLLSLISSAPKSDAARLGLLLSEADAAKRKEILSFLKCSNKQKSGANAVAEGCCEKVWKKDEVSRFVSKYRDYAPDALCVSVLLGNSSSEAPEMALKSDAPKSIKDLAIDGSELISLGFKGRDVGSMLSILFDMALDEPSINEKETLLKIAAEKRNSK